MLTHSIFLTFINFFIFHTMFFNYIGCIGSSYFLLNIHHQFLYFCFHVPMFSFYFQELFSCKFFLTFLMLWWFEGCPSLGLVWRWLICFLYPTSMSSKISTKSLATFSCSTLHQALCIASDGPLPVEVVIFLMNSYNSSSLSTMVAVSFLAACINHSGFLVSKKNCLVLPSWLQGGQTCLKVQKYSSFSNVTILSTSLVQVLF